VACFLESQLLLKVFLPFEFFIHFEARGEVLIKVHVNVGVMWFILMFLPSEKKIGWAEEKKLWDCILNFGEQKVLTLLEHMNTVLFKSTRFVFYHVHVPDNFLFAILMFSSVETGNAMNFF